MREEIKSKKECNYVCVCACWRKGKRDRGKKRTQSGERERNSKKNIITFVCVLVGERGRETEGVKRAQRKRRKSKKYMIVFVSVFVGERGRETDG
jgi:hypothetical protein